MVRPARGDAFDRTMTVCMLLRVAATTPSPIAWKGRRGILFALPFKAENVRDRLSGAVQLFCAVALVFGFSLLHASVEVDAKGGEGRSEYKLSAGE